MDFALGSILRYYYFKQTSGLLYRTTYSIDSTKADIIVFGSSRANHHYVPEIFEDSLKLSFYNTGRDGNFLLYNYAIFNAIVARHNPKIVIFDINPDELEFDINEYDRLSSLLPYYKNHPELRNIISLRSDYEKLKLISSIYPFNSNLLTIAIGNTNRNKARKADNRGYIPLSGFISDTKPKFIGTKDKQVDSNKIKILYEIIKYCKRNHIKLHFIQSPSFKIVKSTKVSCILEQIIYESGANYWCFTNDSIFLSSRAFFKDQDHLNDTGAILFSQIIVNKIAN